MCILHISRRQRFFGGVEGQLRQIRLHKQSRVIGRKDVRIHVFHFMRGGIVHSSDQAVGGGQLVVGAALFALFAQHFVVLFSGHQFYRREVNAATTGAVIHANGQGVLFFEQVGWNDVVARGIPGRLVVGRKFASAANKRTIEPGFIRIVDGADSQHPILP